MPGLKTYARFCAGAMAGAWLFPAWTLADPVMVPRLDEPTALEQYVYTPDPAYSYTLSETVSLPGATVYVLLMDSLRWRSTDEVDRTLWTHQLVVIVPAAVTQATAFYLINGGSDALSPLDPLFIVAGVPIATGTGSVVAVISQIPNQPLQFADLAGTASEDTLVAYSWEKVMDTGEPEWAAYMPMTKAAVRGLDTVQDFVGDLGTTVDDFVVTGFSKRGATAWLVAAADPRVRAVAPGVFDVLDIPLQIERHYRAYGFYAPAVEDYVNFGIVRRGRSPEGRLLTSIVDPISYAGLLTMPKMLLNATGDQFFLPDAANSYLDRLPGETLVSQVPNSDHGFSTNFFEALSIVVAWYRSVLTGPPRPTVTWEHTADGGLVVKIDQPAVAASLWQATNPKARDFRLESFGPGWTKTALEPRPDGTFRVEVAPPAQGYTGYLVVFRFPGVGVLPQTYSTPVFVVPDELPFELEDPVGVPRPASWWRCQLPGMTDCDDAPDYTPGQLEALLPFPVFGKYVTKLDQLEARLQPARDAPARAVRHCAATRLNIAAANLGWYSLTPDGYLWLRYQAIEESYATGGYGAAAAGCFDLNRLEAPAD